MKLKIDENLPAECAEMLSQSGFEADTVGDQLLTGTEDAVIACKCRTDGRVLVTLDLDFANIRAYPPGEYPGIIVFRPRSQDKESVFALVQRIALVLSNREPGGELWIVEPDRIRFRTG